MSQKVSIGILIKFNKNHFLFIFSMLQNNTYSIKSFVNKKTKPI